jgi:hypothetical protein
MRWLTMNLVQDDPGKVDLDFWLDYLRRAHVDAASWNSAGLSPSTQPTFLSIGGTSGSPVPIRSAT